MCKCRKFLVPVSRDGPTGRDPANLSVIPENKSKRLRDTIFSEF
jgi:hypothetical protein